MTKLFLLTLAKIIRLWKFGFVMNFKILCRRMMIKNKFHLICTPSKKPGSIYNRLVRLAGSQRGSVLLTGFFFRMCPHIKYSLITKMLLFDSLVPIFIFLCMLSFSVSGKYQVNCKFSSWWLFIHSYLQHFVREIAAVDAVAEFSGHFVHTVFPTNL